ncbi:CDP-glucose 4,6-dehydratase (plasmid) [Pacificitalea manganoxidans]|uniref:CDP-glucose 4,6-dehydratase n=1 Tax=Pacificitalea manganoxidans TaxID=1411902 RepID=A0A291M5D3_9RHOB|nr:CDP-glucose 4,6-dehydratase [Pacificitalea manganoxidans]ATI44028.1 CDP-glucose 4,6-dehydratase [Pacificitalea manganoxidans]MDR6310401.1 CDP-glucose 4,6-dehydratase [Pacificitalea manganoxidans]
MIDFWSGKRVLVTGHTGFKGSWLSLWLSELGADLYGIALAPEDGALFEMLDLPSRMAHSVLDIREARQLHARVAEIDPDIVFHLAAQPLVIDGYLRPLETFDTNVMGTANLLNALRDAGKRRAIVCVTTDKVYRNREWEFGYREDDTLGGHDPYSASKAAAELIAASYGGSYFYGDSPVRMATARAGNVIGGGDMSANRLVPDIARSLSRREALTLRHPTATRPWQHVLDPLGGYIMLAEALYADGERALPTAFNFGPGRDAERTVAQLVQAAGSIWDMHLPVTDVESGFHETERLMLNTDRAAAVLGWTPRWGFEHSVGETMRWYKARFESEAFDAVAFTISQIESFRCEDHTA